MREVQIKSGMIKYFIFLLKPHESCKLKNSLFVIIYRQTLLPVYYNDETLLPDEFVPSIDQHLLKNIPQIKLAEKFTRSNAVF